MPVERIDAQVHIWQADHPARPWDRAAFQYAMAHTSPGSPYRDGKIVVTDTDLLRSLDELGIAGAVLVSSGTHYGLDNSYALGAAAASPRLAVVGRIDGTRPDLADAVRRWSREPRALALRLVALDGDSKRGLLAGTYDVLLHELAANSVPLCLYAPGLLPGLRDIAARFPDLSLVLDHLGALQPPMSGISDDPLDFFPDLLALASQPNVTVKLTGFPTLSREPYPYSDLGPWLRRLMDSYGAERVMWGTDATRTHGLVSYRDGTFYLEDLGVLDPDETALVYGGALRRRFNWHDAIPAG